MSTHRCFALLFPLYPIAATVDRSAGAGDLDGAQDADSSEIGYFVKIDIAE